MPKLLLLNDNSEQQNWGAQATPYALKRMLYAAIPDLEIVSFMYSWLTTRFRKAKDSPLGAFHHKDSIPLLSRITSHAEFFPRIVDEFEYVAAEWMAGPDGNRVSRGG